VISMLQWDSLKVCTKAAEQGKKTRLHRADTKFPPFPWMEKRIDRIEPCSHSDSIDKCQVSIL